VARRCWAPFLRSIAIGNSQTHQYPGPLVVRLTYNQGLLIFWGIAVWAEDGKQNAARACLKSSKSTFNPSMTDGLEYNGGELNLQRVILVPGRSIAFQFQLS
jgi:hypothetical protein